MYEYRKLTPEQRQTLVEERRLRGHPPHQPPHLVLDQTLYLLTAACYEHRAHMHTPERRQTVLDLLFEQCIQHGMEIHAWAVLTNHYHFLVQVTEFQELGELFRRVHGPTAYEWNKEEQAQGRKVWYRYSDRAIRSEGHYYTTLNYIHYNPVKHELVASPYDWRWSSVHWYRETKGRAWLRDLWRRYPLRDYGKSWDDM
ncbi:MAG: transposase [Anaerolineae bacterium]|jgi:putative transposase